MLSKERFSCVTFFEFDFGCKSTVAQHNSHVQFLVPIMKCVVALLMDMSKGVENYGKEPRSMSFVCLHVFYVKVRLNSDR